MVHEDGSCLFILSKDQEVAELLKTETDPQIKEFLQEYADQGGNSLNYIGMVLQKGYSIRL